MMAAEEYSVLKPKVALAEYWYIFGLLAVSFATPFIGWYGWRDPVIFARCGSLMVFFAAAAEFVLLVRADKKHILNACRAKAGETPRDFSAPHINISVAAFLLALVGTIIWGFGDLLVEG